MGPSLLHICSVLKETYGIQLWNWETSRKKNNQNGRKLEICKILAQGRKSLTNVGPDKT